MKEQNKNDSKGVTRRNFLVGATTAAGVATAVSVAGLPSLAFASTDKNVVDFKTSVGGFRVITVGTGAPGLNPHRGNPSTMVQYKDKYFLVDCGADSVKSLFMHGLHVKDVKNMLFTHQHMDHNADWVNFFVTGWGLPVGRRTLDLVGPEVKNLHKATLDLYAMDIADRAEKAGFTYNGVRDNVNINELTGDKQTFTLDGVKITAVKVPHFDMQAYAYVFEADGHKVVVTGDLIYAANLPAEFANADILVVDGNQTSNFGNVPPKVREMLLKKVGVGHISEGDIGKLAVESKAKKLVITHLNGDFFDLDATKKMYRDMGFKGEIIGAYDGMPVKP